MSNLQGLSRPGLREGEFTRKVSAAGPLRKSDWGIQWLFREGMTMEEVFWNVHKATSYTEKPYKIEAVVNGRSEEITESSFIRKFGQVRGEEDSQFIAYYNRDIR